MGLQRKVFGSCGFLVLGLALMGQTAAEGPAPATQPAAVAQPEPAPANPTPLVVGEKLEGYTLAWRDEFDGAKLNEQEWQYRPGKRLLGYNRRENVSVGDGVLKIALKKEKFEGMNYTAGGVISKKTFEYGYYEARFRCPPGKGWHTSFWMMAFGVPKEQHRQEIDVCEQDSVNHKGYSSGVIDWTGPKQKGVGRKRFKDAPDLAAGYHVWGCEYTAKEVRFYFDGKFTHAVESSKFSHGPANIWLTSIPCLFEGTDKVDDAPLPLVAEFDWVRFYRKAEESGK